MQTELLIALIGAVGAYLGYLAQKNARQANKAVNGHKDPSAARLYDVVLRMDDRTVRLEDWMLRHKDESIQNTELIEKVEEKIDQVELRLSNKIEEFGCPVRLGQTDTPLCREEKK